MKSSKLMIDKRVEGAELAALAAALYCPVLAPALFSDLGVKDFSDDELGALWSASSQIFDQEGAVSVVALSLAGGVDPNAIERVKALRGAVANVTAERTIRDFRYVHALASLHRMASQVCEQLADVSADAAGLEQVLVGLEFGTTQATSSVGASLPPPSMADVLVAWGERVAAGEPSVVATWGIPLLDDKTGGLRPGSLHVPLANPGGGKSSLALTAAIETALRGTRVLYVSLEMGRTDFAIRVAAGFKGRTRRELEHDLRTGKIQPEELRAYIPSMMTDDHRANTVPAIRALLRRAKIEGQPYQLVVVDYIQLLDGPEENEAQRLERIAYGLATLAVEYECAIIAPAQPNRQSDGSELPTMRQIKGSSGIESAADSVVSMRAFETTTNRYGHRIQVNEISGKQYLTDAADKPVDCGYEDKFVPLYRDVEVALVKARNGQVGKLDKLLRFGCGTFRMWEGSHTPWSAEAELARNLKTHGSHAESFDPTND